MSAALPPLPEATKIFEDDNNIVIGYNANQMRAYATAARADLDAAIERKDALLRHVLACIASAKLCEVNSMSSRQEMFRILSDAQEQIKKELSQ